MGSFEIENGLIGLNRNVLLKLINILATHEYTRTYIRMIQQINTNKQIDPYMNTENIENIIGLSNETYKLKENWYFHEIVEDNDNFDLSEKINEIVKETSENDESEDEDED